MRDAAGDSGEFYTPRPLVRMIVKAVDPQPGEVVTPVPVGRQGAACGSAVRSHACEGGQASDQASERGARPVPARSPGRVNAKTPPAGVSKTSSHERARSGTSLAIGPDGTLSLSQQDLSPVPLIRSARPRQPGDGAARPRRTAKAAPPRSRSAPRYTRLRLRAAALRGPPAKPSRVSCL